MLRKPKEFTRQEKVDKYLIDEYKMIHTEKLLEGEYSTLSINQDLYDFRLYNWINNYDKAELGLSIDYDYDDSSPSLFIRLYRKLNDDEINDIFMLRDVQTKAESKIKKEYKKIEHKLDEKNLVSKKLVFDRDRKLYLKLVKDVYKEFGLSENGQKLLTTCTTGGNAVKLV